MNIKYIFLKCSYLLIGVWCALGLAGCSSSKSTSSTNAIVLYPKRGFALGPLVVFGGDKGSSLDDVGGNIFMVSDFGELIPCHERSCESETIKLAFPGYEVIGHTALSRDSAARMHELRELEYIRRISIGDTPLAYGRLVGQSTGNMGVLFIDGGLGFPRAVFTPGGMLCLGWDRLEQLLVSQSPSNKLKLYVLRGTETHVGQYAITGFEAEEIPLWAR